MRMERRQWLKREIGKSAAVRILSGYRAADRRFTEGMLGKGIPRDIRNDIRRACLIARERSAFFAMGRRLAHFLLRGSVGSYGSLLLLSSLLGLMGRIALGRFSVVSLGFVVCVTVIAASVFLLHSKKSLAYALEESLLASWIFFCVCHLPRDRLGNLHRGEERPWLTLLFSLFGGALVCFLHPLTIFLAVVGILFLMLVQTTPELLLYVLLFLFPFFNLLPHPTKGLLALLLVGEVLWLGKLVCGHRICRLGMLEMMILLFACLIFLGGIFGASGTVSFFSGCMLAVLLLSYFPAVSFFSQPLWRRRGFLAISSSAFLCSLTGIFQYVLGMAELRWVDPSRFSDIGGRVTSFFQNPNVLGVYLLLTFPVALIGLFSAQNRARVRVFYGGVAICELLCLLLTWSRGAWLGAILEIVVFLLLRSNAARRILLLGLFVVGVWLPLLPHSVRNRFASIGMLGESSIRYRFYTWRGALRMLKSRPFGIGIGEASFCTAFRAFAVSGTETVMHSHNLFLEIALELGVVGLVAFLLILLLSFWACFGDLLLRDRSDDTKGGTLCGLCALLGALAMGLFDYIWYHYGLFWLFFVMLAMAVSGGTQSEDVRERGELSIE